MVQLANLPSASGGIHVGTDYVLVTLFPIQLPAYFLAKQQKMVQVLWTLYPCGRYGRNSWLHIGLAPTFIAIWGVSQ